MSVRFVFPKPRLGALLRKPGGLPAVEALENAGRNLQALRGACLEDLDAAVSRIEALFARLPPAFDSDAMAELYTLCLGSVGVAGAVGMDAIDTALSSL